MLYQVQEQQQQIEIKVLASQIVHKKNIKQARSQPQLSSTNGIIKNNKRLYSSHSSNNLRVHTNINNNSNNNISNIKCKKVVQNDYDVQSLDISDMLKTISHQKRVLTEKRRIQLIQIHKNSQLNQDDYKHFMMVASQANYRKLQHPGYYKQLLSQVNKYPQLFFVCIDKDIPRTMPDDHPLQNSLRNVLYAYAIRNPSLLYCQGMNYLVGFLLINKFVEEQAFWFMVQLIQDIVMPDYFKDLSTISITVQVFQDIMAQVFPQLFEQMQQVGMESGIFLVGWFICLFTKGFINSVSQHLLQQIVLDSYCYPIGFILIKVSISILATLFTREQRFQFQQKDFRSLKQTIQSSVYEISLDQLKKGIDFYQFNYESYIKLAHIYTSRRQKTYAKALQKQLNQKKLSLAPCNIEKPVCIHRVQIEKKIGTIQQVLILKNDIPIAQQYIQNYFPTKVNRGQGKLVYQNAKQCPITHHTHICKMSNENKLLPSKKLAEQSQKYYPINQGECSMQIHSRFSKIQDRYNQFSSFFVIDENRNADSFPQDDIIQLNDDQGYGLDGNQQKYQSNKSENRDNNGRLNFVASVGNVFRKAIDGIKLLRGGEGFNHKNLENSHSP